MSKHTHHDVIIAWAEGKPIQYRRHDAEPWFDITPNTSVAPTFEARHQYRIKPELRTMYILQYRGANETEWRDCSFDAIDNCNPVWDRATAEGRMLIMQRTYGNSNNTFYRIVEFKEVPSDG